MNTDRSLFKSIENSELHYEALEAFTEKSKLVNEYLNQALDLENPVSPMDLLDEYEVLLNHIEQLAYSSDKVVSHLINLTQKKVDEFDNIRYQIGPSFVELHNRLFPMPDLKARHHVLKTACYLTKYDSLENRDFIIEIKQIHDRHFKKTIKRE